MQVGESEGGNYPMIKTPSDSPSKIVGFPTSIFPIKGMVNTGVLTMEVWIVKNQHIHIEMSLILILHSRR